MFSFSKHNEDLQEKKVEFSENLNDFHLLLDFIKQKTGIDLFSKQDMTKHKIIKFALEKNILSFLELMGKIRTNKDLLQELYNLITVCETYFYRELKQLNYAIKHIKLLSATQNVRVLCAPCSSGEEVYSLCMMCDIAKISNVSIIGIDINSEIIEKAKNGFYSPRSLSSLPLSVKNLYFKEQDGGFLIMKEKFSKFDFRLVNVFDDKLFTLGSFDVIFSRNMMIYFNEEEKRNLIERFARILNNNGVLFTGHADLVPHTDLFEKCFADQTNFYQKI